MVILKIFFYLSKKFYSHVVATFYEYMSFITRKPVFRVCDQGRLKSACAATEARQGLEILDVETRGIILFRQ